MPRQNFVGRAAVADRFIGCDRQCDVPHITAGPALVVFPLLAIRTTHPPLRGEHFVGKETGMKKLVLIIAAVAALAAAASAPAEARGLRLHGGAGAAGAAVAIAAAATAAAVAADYYGYGYGPGYVYGAPVYVGPRYYY